MGRGRPDRIGDVHLAHRAGRRWHVMPLAAAALCALLGWEIVTRGVAANLAAVDPAASLRLRPSEVTALLTRADALLATALAAQGGAQQRHGALFDPATRTRVRLLASRALAGDPLNARAMRVLAQTEDGKLVEPLMLAAVHRSVRESVAVYWLMRKRAGERNYVSALRYADMLMRTRGRARVLAAPVLSEAAEAGAPDALAAMLAARPPWRTWALREISLRARDPNAALKLLFALRDTAHPPTAGELRDFLQAMIARGSYELARYAWLQFLPPRELQAAGYLFNGGFEHPASGLPFDWTIDAARGVTAEVITRGDAPKQHALRVGFGALRTNFNGVSQLLMLPAGAYRLTGNYKGSLRGGRGPVWMVGCEGAGPPRLAASAVMLGEAPAWQRFDANFTVPESGCAVQALRLTVDALPVSDEPLDGTVQYDDLEIVNAAGDGRAEN
jgi:hypothetical protein